LFLQGFALVSSSADLLYDAPKFFIENKNMQTSMKHLYLAMALMALILLLNAILTMNGISPFSL
jgi:hypothetical protein